MTALDEFIKDRARDTPRGVSHRRRGRDVRRPAEDDGHVDIAEVALWPFAGSEVDEDRGDETD